MKTKHHNLKLTALLVSTSIATGGLQAATINVDFNTAGASVSSDITYSGTTAAPDSGTTWNGVAISHTEEFVNGDGRGGFVTANVSNQALVDSNGNATNLTLSLDNSNDTTANTLGVFSAGEGNSVIVPDQYDLMRDYLTTINGGTSVVTLSGLDAGTTYDFYLYGAGDAAGGRATSFTISGANTASSSTSGALDASNGLTLGEEYTVINGITASELGEITINYTRNGDGEGPFNGFQLISSPVPEPSSSAMILGGIGMLTLLRRRKG